MNDHIPVYKPDLDGNVKSYVNDCLETTWISSKGTYIKKFEDGFASYTGLKHAAAVSNGTVALHLALLALGIGPGDEVIVPTLTYIASVNAIAYVGAKPVFIDADADTWQMDVSLLEKKITQKTRAIIVVHLYGNATDMEHVVRIAKKHNLRIIEDCAESIGTIYGGKHVGNYSDIATFSFFGNKTITTGEGGMLLSNSKDLIAKVIHLKGQGLSAGREYWHDVIGFNYRMTNICAAIGCAQLERVQEFITRKRAIAEKYENLLSNSPYTMQMSSNNTVSSHWMVSVLVDNSMDRDKLRAFLNDNKIETRPLFYPIHTMPMYLDHEIFPVALDLSKRGINLPSWPGLSDSQVEKIASLLLEFYDRS